MIIDNFLEFEIWNLALPFTPAIAPAGSSLKQSTGLFFNAQPWAALSAVSFFRMLKKGCRLHR